MAFRFRKQIRLAPGVRLNLSKSGPSLSIGMRGFSRNISARGTRQTLSVPGTGLSWSSYQSHGKSASGPRRTAYEREAVYNAALEQVDAAEAEVRNTVDAWRSMLPVLPPEEVREVFAPKPYPPSDVPVTPDLARAERQHRERIRNQLAKTQSAIPAWVVGTAIFTGIATSFATQSLVFAVGVLTWAGIRALVRQLKLNKKVRETHEGQWPAERSRLLEAHEAAVQEHHAAEMQKRLEWEAAERARFEELERVLAGDRELVEAYMQAGLEHLDFPFDAQCSAALAPGALADSSVIAVDLPEIEDVIPETRLRALKNGTVKEVRRTQKEMREAWRHLVLGIAVQLARTACSFAPTLSRVRVAGYTQRRQRSGLLVDEWVYEIDFDRDFLAALDPQEFDPSSLLRLASSRVNPGNDGSLKKIHPPEWLALIESDVA